MQLSIPSQFYNYKLWLVVTIIPVIIYIGFVNYEIISIKNIPSLHYIYNSTIYSNVFAQQSNTSQTLEDYCAYVSNFKSGKILSFTDVIHRPLQVYIGASATT